MSNQQGCKITVYWLNESRAHRIVWMLEELKLEYDLKVYKRDKNMLAPDELKQIHPLGKSPIIEILAPGAERPVIIAESGAIVEYLAEHFGSWLIPKRYPDGMNGAVGAETEEWMRYRHLMHYAEGSLMTILIISLVAEKIRNAPVPFFLKFLTRGIANNIDASLVTREVNLNLHFLEDQLATSPNNGEFFCGELTGADVMMFFALEAAMHKGLTESSHPKLYAYVRRIQARRAYQRAGTKASEASGEAFVPFSEAEI